MATSLRAAYLPEVEVCRQVDNLRALLLEERHETKYVGRGRVLTLLTYMNKPIIPSHIMSYPTAAARLWAHKESLFTRRGQ